MGEMEGEEHEEERMNFKRKRRRGNRTCGLCKPHKRPGARKRGQKQKEMLKAVADLYLRLREIDLERGLAGDSDR